MKITIFTPNARGLKAKILKDAKDGILNTWEYRSNNEDKYITHSPEQWIDKVLLIFTPSNDNQSLEVVPSYWRNQTIPTPEDYGTILGRFAERLWIQYRDDISSFVSDVN